MELLTIDRKLKIFSESTPDKIAIEFGEEEVTYEQLDKRTDTIAKFLIDNYKDEKNVFVMMARTPKLVEALIGVIKSGGVFIPLDYSFPDNRLINMISEIKVDWIITTFDLLEKVNIIVTKLNVNVNVLVMGPNGLVDNTYFHNLKIHFIDNYRERLDMMYEYSNNKYCYIYFTSGSTGKPKGVLGRHKSLMQFIEWEIKEMEVTKEFKVSQLTPISFDPFLRDIFVPLCAGGTLCMPNNQEIVLNPMDLIKWIEEKEINLIHMVPSLFRIMSDNIESADELISLKYILLAGEILRGNDIEKFMKVFGGRIQLVNLYGPTETTLAKAFHRIGEEDCNKSIVPVGKPIDFTEILILNDELQLCLKGVEGNVYIRTPFITSGYYNDKDLTNEVFIKNPFSTNPNDIIYKTGDLGRRLFDNNIEIVGRKDNQVKIRGMRIELAEIENTLIKNDDIVEAVVVAKEDKSYNKYLWAYIITNNEISIDCVREYLSNHLPEHMIPSYFVRMDKLPLTPSGKINRNALLESNNEIRLSGGYAGPENEIEKRLIEIWSRILGIDKVGTCDNFFAIGGNSLKAIGIVDGIYKKMNLRIPITEILSRPTIKELANNILNKGFVDYMDSMIMLNKKKSKNIFAFPPMIGYGVCFKALSDLIETHTIYAFEFIENENRIQEYIKLIRTVQKDGPYVVMGYSAGGKLAFEVAKALEEKGYEVSDIILFDSSVNEGILEISDDDTQNMIENLMNGIKEFILTEAPSMKEYIEQSVERKIRMYSMYVNSLITTDTVNGNIHQILCSNEQRGDEVVKLKKKWGQLTKKSFAMYTGVGEHGNMINAGNVEKNAEELIKILQDLA